MCFICALQSAFYVKKLHVHFVNVRILMIEYRIDVCLKVYELIFLFWFVDVWYCFP